MAYNASFPDIYHKAGIRRFPNLVQDHPNAPDAWISQSVREKFRNDCLSESFMAVGMKDPVLGPSVMKVPRSYIKGCPKPFEVKEAGHFVQEWGDQIAIKALEHFNL